MFANVSKNLSGYQFTQNQLDPIKIHPPPPPHILSSGLCPRSYKFTLTYSKELVLCNFLHLFCADLLERSPGVETDRQC